MTFWEAATASPVLTWTVIGMSVAPFVIWFTVHWIQYRPYRAALKLAPADVRFWTVRYMSDVTDIDGYVMGTEPVRELCMQVKGKSPVTITRSHLGAFIAEVEAHGFKVDTSQ